MCPHCKKQLGNINVKDVNINAGIMGNQWKGIAYCCPWCQSVLSVSIDPIAIKTDTVDDLFARLRKA